VGQHAKAGSEYAHLAHTQGWHYLDLAINGLSIGEFGQFGLCALELGVPVIFCAGDLALCREATALVPGIETVAVKRGTTPGTGNELDAEAYAGRNTSAIHIHPFQARERIRAGAERAARRVGRMPRALPGLVPPYELVLKLRPHGGQPASVGRAQHPTRIAALLNTPCEFSPVE
jgi:D-aminopeptidase